MQRPVFLVWSTRLNLRGPCQAREVRNGSAPAFQTSEGSKPLEQGRERQRELLAAALAHGEALVRLAVAVDDRDRDLLELCGADPLADRLGRLRGLGPEAGLAQAVRERLRRLGV